jgi:acetyl-CoA acetyltransferase
VQTIPLHQVAIVGVYNTKQAIRLEGRTSDDLTREAFQGALADAGLEPSDVDGFTFHNGVGIPAHVDSHLSRLLGNRPRWTGEKRLGVAAVLEAAAAIASGYCQTVVISVGQAGEFTNRQSTAPWTRADSEFVACWGLHTAVEFALVAKRHMYLYGTLPEQLAEVSATIRNNANINPSAVYFDKGPYTRDDVLNSRMIADPFHLLDCSMTSEGGAALVLTTATRAKALGVRPIYLLGGALESLGGPAYTRPPVFDEVRWVGRWAAAKSFAMAGCQPSEVDVCEFYDPYSFEIIRQFEAFGFCSPGDGGPFVMNGRIRTDGEFPVCTDGGTMAFSHPGLAQTHQKIISAVEQLRGAAGPRQVQDAKIAMVSNGGSSARFCDVLLLGSQMP